MALCYMHQAMHNHFVVAWCICATMFSCRLCSI